MEIEDHINSIKKHGISKRDIIGEGTFGVAFKFTSTSGKEMVIKRIDKSKIDPKYQNVEVWALNTLYTGAAKNIIGYYGEYNNDDEQHHYLVMEYAFADLEKLLKDIGLFSEVIFSLYV